MGHSTESLCVAEGWVVGQGAELKTAAVEVLRNRGRVLLMRAPSTPYGGTPGLRSAMPDGESAAPMGSVCDARWIPPRTTPMTANTATQVPILVQLQRMFMVSISIRGVGTANARSNFS